MEQIAFEFEDNADERIGDLREQCILGQKTHAKGMHKLQSFEHEHVLTNSGRVNAVSVGETLLQSSYRILCPRHVRIQTGHSSLHGHCGAYKLQLGSCRRGPQLCLLCMANPGLCIHLGNRLPLFEKPDSSKQTMGRGNRSVVYNADFISR